MIDEKGLLLLLLLLVHARLSKTSYLFKYADCTRLITL